jgi:hypothetical protein
LAAYYQAWVGSPHAKTDSEAFKHWDTEGAVPTGCAKCHSSPGYLDFLGADGSEAGKVDKAAPVGSVITCDACHSKAAASLTTVTFPSGATVSDMGDSTRCAICHQGRNSTVQVNAAIEKAGLKDSPDKVEPKLTFVNVHYFAAAASLYGSVAHGGYEFTGKLYQGRNTHVDGYTTCASCHDPHTLQVRVEACSTCHKDVKTVEDLRSIRMNGSLTDYNGNGDVKEGIAAELDGMKDTLYKTIQAYAANVAGKPLVYDPAANPYFFYDKNANGTPDKDELVSANRYASFTPVLLEAAYNYQTFVKDPGAFAHNPKYYTELLYDSVEALNKGMGGTDAVLSKLQRDAPGHFNAASMPFRDWDETGEVPSTCTKCHTSGGLAVFLKNNVSIAMKPSNSLTCATCHDDLTKFTVRASTTDKVTFPSGAAVSLGRKNESNICLNCHQGRESTVSVNKAITAAGVGADVVSDKLNFRNVHYFAAGASLFGADVQGAYQYEGKEYSGRSQHPSPYQTCTSCHDTHALTVKFDKCTSCHEKAASVEEIRAKEDTVDYNGNGNSTEPIKAEMASFQETLLAQIYNYAAKTAGAAIVYDPNSYPYWFADLNANGKLDADEAKTENSYKKWTPNLLRAAYNYQYSVKDPGAFAHNPGYILQALYDSIESLGGKDALGKFKRPEVRATQ